MHDALKRALVPMIDGGARPAPGLHHFIREVDGRAARYHLRIEADGSGTLIANATAAARLSPTGVLMAVALLRGRGAADAGEEALRAFRGADAERTQKDARNLERVIDEMTNARGRYPITSIDDPESSVHRRTLSAPLSADVTATEPEAARAILRRLWEAGIPQVTLCLPAEASAESLVALVEHAEDLGLIAGVRARATALSDRLVADLAAAGLDHLDLGWAGPEAAGHDALFGAGDFARAGAIFTRCRELELCPVAVTPLLESTLERLDEMAADLAERQVGAWSVFALVRAESGESDLLEAPAVRQAAATAEELADHFGLNLLWAPPVECSVGASVSELAIQGPRTTGEAGIRVESDGVILAPVGGPGAVGNVSSDPWRTIWSHPAFERWREAVDDPARCSTCPEMAICSAGCPADPATWASSAEKGESP
jgi:radical SAM protein with 4Fe4S-binding SPASM domain